MEEGMGGMLGKLTWHWGTGVSTCEAGKGCSGSAGHESGLRLKLEVRLKRCKQKQMKGNTTFLIFFFVYFLSICQQPVLLEECSGTTETTRPFICVKKAFDFFVLFCFLFKLSALANVLILMFLCTEAKGSNTVPKISYILIIWGKIQSFLILR